MWSWLETLELSSWEGPRDHLMPTRPQMLPKQNEFSKAKGPEAEEAARRFFTISRARR